MPTKNERWRHAKFHRIQNWLPELLEADARSTPALWFNLTKVFLDYALKEGDRQIKVHHSISEPCLHATYRDEWHFGGQCDGGSDQKSSGIQSDHGVDLALQGVS